jgi:hypothetical protein
MPIIPQKSCTQSEALRVVSVKAPLVAIVVWIKDVEFVNALQKCARSAVVMT